MIKKLKIGLSVIVLTLFVGVGYASAANLSWGAATLIDLSSPDVNDMTIASGSAASALVVEVGDIIVTADSVGTFTVSSASRTLVPSSTSGITQTCTSGVSQIVIAAGTAARTISTTAPQCGTGGSGGGGGGSDTVAPTSASVSINAGATTASSISATLTLSATDNVGVTQMLISNDAGFAGATWVSYATSKAWTLTSGDGVKTVYARFRDAALNMSSIVSDTITVSGTGTTAPSSNDPTGGCSNGNQYNLSTGNLCINTLVHSYNFGTKTLKNGSRGEAVKELQRFLNATMNLGLVVDGKLGPKTIAVMKKWQKAHSLVVDGLIGPKTKAAMLASI